MSDCDDLGAISSPIDLTVGELRGGIKELPANPLRSTIARIKLSNDAMLDINVIIGVVIGFLIFWTLFKVLKWAVKTAIVIALVVIGVYFALNMIGFDQINTAINTFLH